MARVAEHTSAPGCLCEKCRRLDREVSSFNAWEAERWRLDEHPPPGVQDHERKE